MTDEIISNWLELINAKPKTRKTFSYILKRFFDYLQTTKGQSHEEVIEAYIQDIKDGKIMPEREIFKDVPRFLSTIKNCGYAPKTINLYKTALKSFFKSNYIEFPITGKSGKVKTLPQNSNKFLQREQVKQMLEHAHTVRDKAIILTMVTSGMASAEIRKLKMSNIVIDNNDIATVKLRREKAEHDYVTFISPEAVGVLREYWEYRERVTGQKKKKTDFVFVGIPENHIKTNKPVNERALMDLFERVAKKMGVEREEGALIQTRSHALRKYFSNSLRRAGMPKDYVDALIGHVPSDTDKAYFTNLEDVLLKEYIKYLPYITFKDEIVVRSLDTEDAKRLEELETLKQEQSEELHELRRQMEAITELLKIKDQFPEL